MFERTTPITGSVNSLRLAAPEKTLPESLREIAVDQDDINECAGYFRSADVSLQNYLDFIFTRHGQRGKPQTRFTDGTIPTLYTALEYATCESEKARWLGVVGPVYLQSISVHFHGTHADLTTIDPVPAFLTGEMEDGAYDECLQVTKEALASTIHGFATPSARRVGGKCFPIIARPAIRGITPGPRMRFDYDSVANEWTSVVAP